MMNFFVVYKWFELFYRSICLFVYVVNLNKRINPNDDGSVTLTQGSFYKIT